MINTGTSHLSAATAHPRPRMRRAARPREQIDPKYRLSHYSLIFLVFRCFSKTANNVGGNNREHLSDILSKRAHGVIHLFCYIVQQGRWHCCWKLWTVSICIAAVFMTTTPSKGCNLSHFLFINTTCSSARYMLISRAALLHFSCCPFWAVFLTLNFLFVCTISAFFS